MNKIEIKNLLKKSPIAMIVAGLLGAGIVSAMVLAVYTTMLGVGNVEQAVIFGNGDVEKTYTIGSSNAIAGNTYTQDYNLKNQSETTAPIKFITTQCIVGGGNCNTPEHIEEGVKTSYWSAVELENKNPDWNIIDDNTRATLTYELLSPTFNYEFEATGLDVNENYSLIYYADKPERFENWGGNNPGVLIAEFITDDEGNISEEGNKNLQMNLPTSPDWNATAEANYCDSDSYDLCRGAKIWLVPSSSYNDITKELNGWNPDTYLFETDLITYDDTDTDGVALYLGTGMLNFFVKNEFAVNLAPGEYKVKTEVIPVAELIAEL
ncbi:MAG: hypothetical protein KJI70_00675 [Patescibacteria group bacterium]|nr:hypothetical protein [Patescibacteria group bacterium]